MLQAVEHGLLPRRDVDRPGRPAAHPLPRDAAFRRMRNVADAPEGEGGLRDAGPEAAFEAHVVRDPVRLQRAVVGQHRVRVERGDDLVRVDARVREPGGVRDVEAPAHPRHGALRGRLLELLPCGRARVGLLQEGLGAEDVVRAYVLVELHT